MGRLKAISPRLSPLAQRVGTGADAQGHSRAAEPWRQWYWSARWRELRLRIFERDLFTCQMSGCGRLIGDTSKLVADHIKRHRGDPGLFWNPDNIQTLCKPCHDSAKQAQERRGRGG